MNNYNQNQDGKICPTCNARALTGKSTQRYCSVECKNEHHRIANEMIADLNLSNKRIKRNYIVLLGILNLNSKRIIISEDFLFQFGFDMRSFETRKQNLGKLFSVIADVGFRRIGFGKVEVVRFKKERSYFKEFIDRWEMDFSEIGLAEVNWLSNGVLYFFIRLELYSELSLTARRFIHNRCRPIIT